jgi:hypothetical protein
MITPRHNAFYWSHWKRAKNVLMNGRETWTKDEENRRRHEIHARACGRDCFHYDFTRSQFDRIVAKMMLIIEPDNLDAQLRQVRQENKRALWVVRQLMRELGVSQNYVQGVIRSDRQSSQPKL